MKYTWTGDVKLFVAGVGTIPPHSTFEMDKDSLDGSGVQYLIGTGEIVKGNKLHVAPTPKIEVEPEVVDTSRSGR